MCETRSYLNNFNNLNPASRLLSYAIAWMPGCESFRREKTPSKSRKGVAAPLDPPGSDTRMYDSSALVHQVDTLLLRKQFIGK